MIDCGTYQDGLMMISRIGAVRSGVWLVGLPATIFVFQTSASSRTTLSVKSGMLTITYIAPSSRGIQRQRSTLASTVSSALAGFGPLIAAMVSESIVPVGRRPFLACTA